MLFRMSVWCLSLIGTAALTIAQSDRVTTLIKDLKNGDRETRRSAAHSLYDMGPTAVKAAPALVTALKEDEYAGVRWLAAEALGKISLNTPEAIGALIQATNDQSDSIMRGEAALGLGGIRSSLPEVITALARLLKDEQYPREKAAYALGQIGPKARETVPQLIENLNDKSFEVRIATITGLGGIGPGAEDAVPALIRLISDPNVFDGMVGLTPPGVVSLRTGAARALGNIGAPARQATGALTNCLKDSDIFVRSAAADALKKIGTPGNGTPQRTPKKQ
jgi:HEAT repeat protein